MTNSETYYKLLKSVTPCGSQTLSKMPNRYVEGVYPTVLSRGKGGKVYDVNGNEFIDLISGLGAVSVGYANDYIDNAAYAQMREGTLFSLPHIIEYKAAKRLVDLVPGTDMWKFGKNGTDGTVMAVRAARALTRRTKILTVGYNGCQEMFECQGVRTAGIPEVLKDHNTRAVYNNIHTFKPLYTNDYACVIMEPMVFEYPLPGFLEEVRKMCSETGTVLIFDEVVNGGRFQGFVSSSYFKVVPDLYVLSKGIADGFPLCAVGGPRPIMETFERDDFFASGTFGGECVSLAAFLETTKILVASIDKMVNFGKRIQDAFNSLNWPSESRACGYPTRIDFRFPTKAHRALFWQEMCLNGVLVGYANFVKADNTPDEIFKVVNSIYKSYKVLRSNWAKPEQALKGKMPEEALKKS